MVLAAQEARDVVPLKNWSNPLYWRASRAEREAAGAPTPQLQFSGSQVSPNALSFVAITPCRLLDTRGTATGFSSGPPYNEALAATGTLTIPVQADAGSAACGTIPSIAQAYSVNITLIPVASGQVNYLSIWPAGAAQPEVATMNDKTGLILANAAIVPAGTPSGGVSVYNSGPASTNVVIDMNGFFAAPSDLNGNTAIGVVALAANTGSFNTATGSDSLSTSTTGSYNTADGEYTLRSNVTGSDNTAIGACALCQSTGSSNTALGTFALDQTNLTGNNNIGIGVRAGITAPGSNSNSIYIGSQGTGSDLSGTIQIGTEGTQTGGTLIAGIDGASVIFGSEVYVDSSGYLGTNDVVIAATEQITDLGNTSSKLLQLRPVSFYYKPEYDHGSHQLQYGLVPEEVAKVYPEMVTHGKDGKALSVRYQLLTPLLLNELQKQAAQNQSLEQRIAALEASIAAAPKPVR
jgi:hypothetical protein